MIHRIRPLFPLLMLFSGIAILWAQVIPEGKKIISIEVTMEGPKTLGKSFLLQNLQIEEGMAYDPSSIDKSIRNLVATGAVDDVKVFYDPKNSTDKGVALIFKVRAKPRIKKISFLGNKKLSDKKLEKTISLSVGDMFDDSDFKADQVLIEELYTDKGYWSASVSSDLQTAKTTNDVSIVFKITENEKRKIKQIKFVGNKLLSTKSLLEEMETSTLEVLEILV